MKALTRQPQSMYQQLAYSYSSNKDTAVPCKIALCGLQPFLHTRLKQHKADVAWNTWNCSVSTDPIESIYPIEKLVYLSADADTVLDTLEEDKVYVIGGIVDRNRHKGLCASKAKSLGIKTAKFPLDVYFEKVGFSRVLTTNHCVDVLHEFLACGNWMQACKRGVPVRKLKTRTRKRRMDTGENENAEEEDDSDDEGEEVAVSSVRPLPSEAEDVSERKSSTLASGPQRHALLWGGINDLSRRVCEILIEAGWTVLLTVPDVPSGTLFLRDFSASHANRNGELIITTGELGRIGDLLRVKEVVFKRLERRLDAVIFCQDSFESEEYESTHVTAVSDFVRELFRLWTGEGRTVPRFIFGDNLKHSPSQMMQLLDALRPRLLSSVDFTSSKTELLERVASLKDSAAITWASTNPSTTTG